MLGKEKSDFAAAFSSESEAWIALRSFDSRKQLANRSIIGFSRIGRPDYRTKFCNRIFGL